LYYSVVEQKKGAVDMGLGDEDIQFIKEKLPEPYNTVDRYAEFFGPKLQMHKALCSTTIAAAKEILSPLIIEHSNRFFCRIDDTHTCKTPASIVEKIRRSQEKTTETKKGEVETPEVYDLNNFLSTMTDIVRFRIVCNFISDVERVAEVIQKSEKLKTYLKVGDPKDSINQHRRISGERSIKFILEHKSRSGLFIEIQIMTQLQEAWDKKDHCLVYEKRRSSLKTDEELFCNYLDSKMSAMAELLYVADNYFEQLRKEEEEQDE
jgi:ppGpp synthetase/RelA/SpoT-type nucleotidyltranferase